MCFTTCCDHGKIESRKSLRNPNQVRENSEFVQKGAVSGGLTSSEMHAAASAGELLPAVFSQNEHLCALSLDWSVLLLRDQELEVFLI